MRGSLSVVIVSMNSEEFIVECVDSILENLPEGYSVDVVMVDNCSRDCTVELVRERYQDIKLIVNTASVSLSANNNRGICATKGEYVMILNPDTQVFPGTLQVMLEFMQQNSDVGICGPKLVNPDCSFQPSCRRFPTPLAVLARGSSLKNWPVFRRAYEVYMMFDRKHDDVQDVDWVLGACLMIRRETIEQVGLMDERFRLYYEDIDWCYRVNKKWRVCYVPQAVVMHHYHRESATRLNQKTFWHIRSILRYFIKHRFSTA